MSHQYGNWARSDDRLSSPLRPARRWEYTLSSSLDCLTGDGPRHNLHRGHITGPLVQLFHLQCVPLTCPWFIQPVPFPPATFLSEIILSDYNVSTQKSIGLVQNRCLCKSHLYPSFTPMRRLNIATPVSTFPLRRRLPDWTSYIRANFSSN